MNQKSIATLAEIHGHEPKKFKYRKPTGEVEGFVLEFNGEIRAYQNMCMHEPIALDTGSGKFFDPARTTIYCKNHGATFEPLTGKCTGGPCPGTALKSLPVRVENGNIYLDRK